jgi:hypothetical protein
LNAIKGRDSTATANNSLASKLPPEARCATIEIAIFLRRPTHPVATVTKITVTYTTFINMDLFTVMLTFSLEVLQPKTPVEMWGAMLRCRFVVTIA